MSFPQFANMLTVLTQTDNQNLNHQTQVVHRHLLVCVLLVLSLLNVGFVNAHAIGLEIKSGSIDNSTELLNVDNGQYLTQQHVPESPTVYGHDFQGHDLHEDNECDPIFYTSTVKYKVFPPPISSRAPDSLVVGHVKPLLRPPIL